VPDRRVGFTVEQLAVDPFDVIRAGAVLDAKPVPRPLDVGRPGLRDPLVQLVRAPVLGALAETIRGEEEDGLGPGEL
jgi:hypothetical protein